MTETEGMDPCRVCCIFYLDPEKFLTSLTDENTCQDGLLLFIRNSLESWNIKAEQEDDRVMKVCCNCISVFKNFYQLYLQCIESELLLTQLSGMRVLNMVSPSIKDEPTESFANHEYIEQMAEAVDIIQSGHNNTNPMEYLEVHNPAVNVQNHEILMPEQFVSDYCTVPYGNEEFVTTGAEEEMFDFSFEDSIESMGGGEAALPADFQVGGGGGGCFEQYDDTLPPNIYSSPSSHSELESEEEESVDDKPCAPPSPINHRYPTGRLTRRRCYICGKLFKDVSRTFYTQHVKSHKYRPPLKCLFCGIKFRSYYGRQFHYKLAHAEKYLEHKQNNDEEHDDWTTEESQASEDNEELRYRTEDSQDSQDEENTNDRLMDNCQPSNEDDWRANSPLVDIEGCGSDRMAAITWPDLCVSSSTLDNRLYRCSMCSEVFTTTDNWMNHMYLTHMNNTNTPTSQEEEEASRIQYDCTICGKMFPLRFLLNRHREMVHNLKD